MDLQTYETIVRRIDDHTGLSKECLNKLQEEFPRVRNLTLQSIISHQYQRKVKRNYHKLAQSTQEICKKYKECILKGEQPGIIIRISQELNLVPAVVGKVILENHIREQLEGDVDKISNVKSIVNKLMRNSNDIKDTDLSYEIFLCVMYDDQYGPIPDSIRHSIGIEYEVKLHKLMKERNIIFKTEDDLRKNGFDKTPDAKLEIPISVDGRIVSWIESKALFGDREVHNMYIQEQYLSYWNRFGPGLVIYWFGYLDTIVNPNEKRYLILDKFPDNIVYMDPSKVTSDKKDQRPNQIN